MKNSMKKQVKDYLLYEIDRITGKKIYHSGFKSKYKAYKRKHQWEQLSNNVFHIETLNIWINV